MAWWLRLFGALLSFSIAAWIGQHAWQKQANKALYSQNPAYTLLHKALRGDEVAQFKMYLQWRDKSAVVAEFWLQKAAAKIPSAAWILLQEKFRGGELAQAMLINQKLLDDGYPAASRLRQDWQAMQPEPQSGLCTQRLGFVVSDERSLTQLASFKRAWKENTSIQALPICWGPVWVLPAEQLNCDASSGRIACDEAYLANQLKGRKFTHLVVMTENGKANVHKGIMYLDLEDVYTIFVHELAHFSRLVDEYPLSVQLANQICIEGHRYPNLIVSRDDSQPAKPESWPAIFPAETCDMTDVQAWKPYFRFSFMHFHDGGDLRPEQLAIWHEAAKNVHLQQPAFANLHDASSDPLTRQYWAQREALFFASDQ